MAEFEIPDFLKGQSPKEILRDMTEQIPTDIDISEGSHPYNYIFPTAYIISELIQFRLTEAIKQITPQFCQGYDTMMDYHGNTRGMTRKAAIAATGNVDITANAGTIIPIGSVFSTMSISGSSTIEFKTTEAYTFETDTTATIPIEAVTPGKDGNVQVNTIIVKANDITGITAVNNSTATTGGMDDETLDDFIARVTEFDQNQGQSFIGNPADYKRWAEEVEGVGHAVVEIPTTDDGITKIIITDLNGSPATSTKCADVYNHIMNPTPLSTDGTQPENEVTGDERLAPINAYLKVTSPTEQPITLSVSITIDTEKTTLEKVKTDIATEVGKYLATAEKYIYISDIGAIISGIEGVIDYGMSTLKVNNQSSNIAISANTRPTISKDNVTLSTL